jgi:hypothetical protein
VLLATNPEVRVQFQALPHFLRKCGRGPLGLVSTIEELLGRKSSGSGLKTEIKAVGKSHADYVTPSIRKTWH